MSEEILNNYENYQSYWDLVNAISDLCNEATEKGLLYGDDIISILDRVKTYKIIEHIEYRYNLKHEDETDGNNDIE